MRSIRFITMVTSSLGLAVCAADEVILRNGNQVTGEVESITSDGRITVRSPIFAGPLILKRDALQGMVFEASGPGTTDFRERLQLVNGDVLPGELLGMDEERIDFRTPFAGELTVARHAARALVFGVTPQELVYRGADDLSGWVDNENWKVSSGSLVCSTNGSIARPKVLPGNFILRFRLRWEQSPNLRFFFCDDLLEPRGEADRYYFEVNSSGLQLKRQADGGGRKWVPIATLDRRSEEFTNATVDVEIRVDRENRLLYLYLDGEKEGSYVDPIDDFPGGTGIMLYSLAGGDMKNIVEMIEVFEWDAVSQLRRSEGHSDVERDAIISNDGERFSGSAERLVKEGDGPRILFKSPHSDDLFRIPQRRISTLYFRAVEGSLDRDAAAFTTKWDGDGELGLASLRLDGEKVVADHPLLGELTLDRSALRQIHVVPDDGSTESDAPEAPSP